MADVVLEHTQAAREAEHHVFVVVGVVLFVLAQESDLVLAVRHGLELAGNGEESLDERLVGERLVLDQIQRQVAVRERQAFDAAAAHRPVVVAAHVLSPGGQFGHLPGLFGVRDHYSARTVEGGLKLDGGEAVVHLIHVLGLDVAVSSGEEQARRVISCRGGGRIWIHTLCSQIVVPTFVAVRLLTLRVVAHRPVVVAAHVLSPGGQLDLLAGLFGGRDDVGARAVQGGWKLDGGEAFVRSEEQACRRTSTAVRQRHLPM